MRHKPDNSDKKSVLTKIETLFVQNTEGVT
jgi:hypothetical protein